MKYYFVYSQDAAGNSEQYDDYFHPSTAKDKRMHYGDTSGQRALCGRRTRSRPFRFREDLELCQTCINKLNQAPSKMRRMG